MDCIYHRTQDPQSVFDLDYYSTIDGKKTEKEK